MTAANTTVAVMQPYFYPYAGYFRLFAVADVFVIYDDVQFTRRGRVHRCEVPRADGRVEWLTLPMRHQPRETLICEVAFAHQVRDRFDLRLDRCGWLKTGAGPLADALRSHLYGPKDDFVEFLEAGLRFVANALGLPVRFRRASEFCVPRCLRGQERVLALVEAAGGSVYINAPGGNRLYDPLRFASHYGKFHSMLPALACEEPQVIRDDVLQTARRETADASKSATKAV